MFSFLKPRGHISRLGRIFPSPPTPHPFAKGEDDRIMAVYPFIPTQLLHLWQDQRDGFCRWLFAALGCKVPWAPQLAVDCGLFFFWSPAFFFMGSKSGIRSRRLPPPQKIMQPPVCFEVTKSEPRTRFCELMNTGGYVIWRGVSSWGGYTPPLSISSVE